MTGISKPSWSVSKNFCIKILIFIFTKLSYISVPTHSSGFTSQCIEYKIMNCLLWVFCFLFMLFLKSKCCPQHLVFVLSVRDIKIVLIDICIVLKLVLLCTASPFPHADEACVFKAPKTLGKIHLRQKSMDFCLTSSITAWNWISK